MQGNALENGHFNELIKVKNISSGKIVQGRVINEKKILINY
jgi:flagella basal body P-ring formation protein FlgA